MIRTRFGLLMLCLALVVSSLGVFAEDAPKPEKVVKPKPAKTVGTVDEVGDDSITVAPKAKKAKKGEEAAAPEPVTFKVGENTQVRVDGKKAALADIQAGYAVTVMAFGDEPAVKIEAVSPEEQARRAEEKKAKSEAKAKEKVEKKAGDNEGM